MPGEQQIKRAAAWSALEHGGMALLSLVTLIVFARTLSPQDFGLFSMVLAVVEVGVMLTSTFFQEALIQRQTIDDDHYSTAFWVSFACSLLFVAGCWWMADAFSSTVGSPQGGSVLIVTALTVPAVTLTATAVARLKRELHLKPLALRSLLGRLLAALVGVGMAIAGFGVWAMATQQVLLGLLGSLLLCWSVGLHYRWRVDWVRLKQLLRFGLPATMAQLLAYSVRRVFVFLAGAGLGTEAAGILNIGLRVVEMLWAMCAVAIQQVVMPVLSRRQATEQIARHAYGRAAELACVIVFPAFGLMAALAPEILQLLFGAAWSSAAPSVTVLALVVLIQVPRLLMSSQALASGKPMINGWAGLAEYAVVLACFAVGSPTSLAWVLAIWATREVLGVATCSWLLHRQGTVMLSTQWSPVVTPAAGVLAMLACALVLRYGVLPGDWPSLHSASILLPLCLLAYLGTLLVCDHALSRRTWTWFTGRNKANPGQA